jgi:hypothetical protein
MSMGEMVHGFDSVQRWRLLDSNWLYNVQNLAKVSMGKAWWTLMVHHVDKQSSILIKLFPSYYLTSNKCVPSLVWSNSSIRLHSSWSIMALLASDLLPSRDGSEHIRSREGRFFCGKQLKKVYSNSYRVPVIMYISSHWISPRSAQSFFDFSVLKPLWKRKEESVLNSSHLLTSGQKWRLYKCLIYSQIYSQF